MAEPKIDDNILDPELFPAHRGAPHALFDLWREQDPVHWNPPSPSYTTDASYGAVTKGFWVLTRHKDVLEVSQDQERFSSYDKGFVVWDTEGAELERQRANFMGMRPKDHSEVKRVIVPPFSPKAMLELEPEVERLAREIVDDVVGQGQCEFVFDVASKLPVYTFCELMGIPSEYREAVVNCGNAMADVEGRKAQAIDPIAPLFEIAEKLSDDKRRAPDGRLLSAMVNDRSLNLTQAQINNFFLVFAVAGHETTRSTAAHFIYLMEQHPDQYAQLLDDVDGLLPGAIEEVLRYTSTTTNFCRHATLDTEIGGTPVKKGDKIYLSYAAANRDPAVFEDPHRFDITRSNARKHLSFGTGPHVCVGARLARLQLKYLLKELVTRTPAIHVRGEPQWLKSIWFNAIVEMQVSFSSREAA